MLSIDLNCDMGESFGRYRLGDDENIMDYVTSVNIACGFHAGDPIVMEDTVTQAIKKNKAIGAHPGFPDLLGFGRRSMDINPKEARAYTIYQVGALYGFIKAQGGKLQHVKPHGAFYNLAAKNYEIALGISEAIYDIDPEIILLGLSNSMLIKAGKDIGIRTCSEVFADRTYNSDGTLVSRSHPDSQVKDVNECIERVIRMIKENKVKSLNGIDIPIYPESICIHGDGPNALEFAKNINIRLKQSGIHLLAFGEIKGGL